MAQVASGNINARDAPPYWASCDGPGWADLGSHSRDEKAALLPRRFHVLPALMNHQMGHRSARVPEELYLRLNYLQEELGLRLSK